MDRRQDLQEAQQRVLARARADRRCLAAHISDEVLEVLERRFETRLPVFRGSAGQFDPLDAMRRDAYREVVLWLREQVVLGREEM